MRDSEDFPRRNVLVLGAGGFVGSHLVSALAQGTAFSPVAALRRQPRPDAWPGMAVRVCDATDTRAMASALNGIDCVVNCIAGSPRTMVAATRALCGAARQAHLTQIVHVSSMAVYGAATGLVREVAAPVPPLGAYGEAKRQCEIVIQDYVHDGGTAVILRPSCIHGPGSEQWTGRIARLLRAGRIGDLGIAGDGVCNLVYVDDVTTAILACLTRTDLSGAAFTLSDPEPPTWNEYLMRFGQALGATPVRRLSPRRIALESRLVAPVLRVAGIAAGAARLPRRLVPDPITPSLAALWRQDLRLDVSAASQRLGVRFTPLDHALARSVRWLGAPDPPAPAGSSGCEQTQEAGK